MSEIKFKTLRHIETVRNCMNSIIIELLKREEQHDQSKLCSPEAETFEKFTHKLRGLTYGSDEYKKCLTDMGSILKHHYDNNDHHPEHYQNGIKDMTLITLIEMICDWYAATKRHDDGDIFKSIELNQKRFNYGDELKQIFINTAKSLNSKDVFHKANES